MANKYMINIPGHKRNANQSTVRFHFTLVRMAIIKNISNKYWRRCGKKEPSYTISGNVNQYNYYGKQNGGSSKT
jgi:hypothetical protein